MQAAKTAVTAIPGTINASAVSNSISGPGLCDYSFTPSIELTNNDTATVITSVVAEYTMDGAAPVQITYSGNLSTGQSASIQFPLTSLTPGLSNVSYNIVSINGGTNWVSANAVSISDETYNTLNDIALSGGISENMENAVLIAGTGYSREISSGIFSASAAVPDALFSVLDGPSYNYGAIGGFGNSNRSIRFRYFDVAPGEKLELIMQKVNLGVNSQLTFSHAYRQYIDENDQLEVFVSTDCGATWNTVFNKAGSALATLTANTTSFVPTSATDWLANTVDLSAYDNTSNVVIKFTGTSGFGNNLFLDDIVATSTLSNNEVLGQSSLKLYPNPTSDYVKVSGLNDSRDYAIYNLLGMKVAQGTINNNDSLDVRSLSSGLFILEIAGYKANRFIKK